MNHLATIQTEFTGLCKMALDSDWWKKLSLEEQRQYVLQHRRTKLRPNLRPSSVARSILTKAPVSWKKILTGEQIGENSEFTQLSDKVRPRELKAAFDESGVKAIVAFIKPDVTNHELKPAFLITKSSWKEDKFRASMLTEDKGLQDVAQKKNRVVYRRRYGARSWTETINDLRMTAIAESIPDKPYLIYALKMDEERLKTRQERSALKEKSTRRSIENKLIAEIAKPIYDYYDENLQKQLQELRDAAIPSFDKVINGKYESISNDVIEKVKDANTQIDQLSSSIRSFGYYHLTEEGKAYSQDSYDRQSFMKHLKEFKQKFAKQYNVASRRRLKYVIDSINKNDYADAIYQLDLIKQKELSDELKSIVKDANVSDDIKMSFISKVLIAKHTLLEEFELLKQRQS